MDRTDVLCSRESTREQGGVRGEVKPLFTLSVSSLAEVSKYLFQSGNFAGVDYINILTLSLLETHSCLLGNPNGIVRSYQSATNCTAEWTPASIRACL
jgi:hypothetical protein